MDHPQQPARLERRHLVLVSLRRQLRHHMGPRLVDIPGRDLPQQDPRQGRQPDDRNQLVL